MRSNEAKDEALRARLEAAVRDHAGGSADRFARLIGYTNGGYIREIINKKNSKVVREALIERVNSSKECPALHGLFDDILKANDEDRIGAIATRLRRLQNDQGKEFLLNSIEALITGVEALPPPLDITHQHRGRPALSVKPPGPPAEATPAERQPAGTAQSGT